MTKHVLFIQGAGEGAYEEDKALAASLRQSLGPAYEVHYPAMPDEDNAPYDQWTRVIEQELASLPSPVILVGHSVGASVIAKWLSELKAEDPIANAIRGVFLMSNPFWGGDGWRYDGYEELELPDRFAASLPKHIAIALYHARDDETVPFGHLALYTRILPQASVHEIDEGGHQLNNDLSAVAHDIKTLQ